MSATKPIPQAMRNEMASDPFYSRCCLCHKTNQETKIEWHHNLTSYTDGNKGRVNEKECILPLCEEHHSQARRRDIKELCDWIMLSRASDEQIAFYSKAVNYALLKIYLVSKFGQEWKPNLQII